MSATVDNKPVIGITCGDLNGIGIEIIIKTLADNRILDFCTPVLNHLKISINNRYIYRSDLLIFEF